MTTPDQADAFRCDPTEIDLDCCNTNNAASLMSNHGLIHCHYKVHTLAGDFSSTVVTVTDTNGIVA